MGSTGVATMSRRTRRASLGHPAGKGGRRPAFTLLELLVTILIITLLLTILIPNLLAARDQAQRTVCLSHLRAGTLSVISYANQNNDNLPGVAPRIVARESGKVSPRELLAHPSANPQQVNMGLLWEMELPNMSALLCPSAQRSNFSRDLELLADAAIPVACDYAYAVSIAAGDTAQLHELRSTALLADNFVASDFGNGLGLGYWSHRTGYNVAFPDGSVSFYADPTGSIANARISYDYEDDGSIWEWLTAGDPPLEGEDTDNYEIYQAWLAFSLNLSDPFGD